MTERREDQTPDDSAALSAMEALRPAGAREAVTPWREVVDELAWNGPLVTPPASLKARLMARLAEASPPSSEPDPFLFVPATAGTWREMGNGMSTKVLCADATAGRVTALVRLAPGGSLGAHRHAQVEELYVLEGSCLCAGRLLQTGDYHRAAAASLHPLTVSEQGCLALVMTSLHNEPTP